MISFVNIEWHMTSTREEGLRCHLVGIEGASAHKLGKRIHLHTWVDFKKQMTIFNVCRVKDADAYEYGDLC